MLRAVINSSGISLEQVIFSGLFKVIISNLESVNGDCKQFSAQHLRQGCEMHQINNGFWPVCSCPTRKNKCFNHTGGESCKGSNWISPCSDPEIAAGPLSSQTHQQGSGLSQAAFYFQGCLLLSLMMCCSHVHSPGPVLYLTGHALLQPISILQTCWDSLGWAAAASPSHDPSWLHYLGRGDGRFPQRIEIVEWRVPIAVHSKPCRPRLVEGVVC